MGRPADCKAILSCTTMSIIVIVQVTTTVMATKWVNKLYRLCFLTPQISNTTGIRGFAECCILCRVPFAGHSAKKALPSAALGKVRLSAKSPLPSAKHSAQVGTRQRQVCRV
jgi:hypothetical protein